MRNLKRVLSLTLASVMLLGMMVIGSSAAGYSDVDYDEDNVEAIEVLNAVGVMLGDADSSGNLTGTFRPGDEVKRSEMARIMAALMDLDYEYYTGTNPFTDMVGHWAEGYVAACYANGIIAGRTTTTYDPDATVTTVEAAAMLMRALGYFQYASDYADGFEIATIRQAGRIDLFNGVDTKTNEPMTRNDVAQLVLNTLKSGMVEPDSSSKVEVTVGDAQVTVGGTNYVYVTSREKYATAIRNDEADIGATATTNLTAPIVDLGEKLYQGDLTRATINDALGRPAQHWEYKTRDIGTYADEPDYFFSSKVTSKKLYDTIGSVASSYKNWAVYVNGEPVDYDGDMLRKAENRVDDDKCFLKKADVDLINAYSQYTGNGVVTEIYVDDTVEALDGQGKVTIAVYNLFAAEVMRVIESDGTIVLTDLDNGPATAAHEFETDLFDEDDIVVYTFSAETDEIQSVALAERIAGTITRVRTDTDGTGKDDQKSGDLFVVDGQTYNYNATVSKGERLQTETVNNDMVGYLDEFGYCIYIDKAAVSYDYAYVLAAGTDGTRYGTDPKGKTIYARLAFTDGTTAAVETDNAPGQWLDDDGVTVTFENMIVSYSVDKNGIYTLTPADNYYGSAEAVQAPNLEIKNNVSSFRVDKNNSDQPRYSANSNTSFVLVSTDLNSYNSYSFSAYTGVDSVPSVDGVASTQGNGTDYDGSWIAVATERGSRVAKAVFVLDGNVSGGDVFFIRAKNDAPVVKDSDIGEYYEISAYVDGEAVTLKVKTETSAARALVTEIGAKGEPGLDISSDQDGSEVIFAADAISENADGLVIGVHLYGLQNKDGNGVIVGEGTDKTNRNLIILGENGTTVQGRYTYKDDAVFTQWVTRNNNNRFEASRANAIKNDNNDQYIAVTDGYVITGICVWYIPDGEGEFKWTEDGSTEGGIPVILNLSEPVPVDMAGRVVAYIYANGSTSEPVTRAVAIGEITVTFNADGYITDVEVLFYDPDTELASVTIRVNGATVVTIGAADFVVSEDGIYEATEDVIEQDEAIETGDSQQGEQQPPEGGAMIQRASSAPEGSSYVTDAETGKEVTSVTAGQTVRVSPASAVELVFVDVEYTEETAGTYAIVSVGENASVTVQAKDNWQWRPKTGMGALWVNTSTGDMDWPDEP